jgi:hypothetical protein
MDRDAPTRLMLARAVWPYTFGIIQDGRFGCHGAAIGTGVGVSWHDRSVIITAGHNLEPLLNNGNTTFCPWVSFK